MARARSGKTSWANIRYEAVALQVGSEFDDLGERTRRTQIVAIGSPIDPQDLNNKFDAWVDVNLTSCRQLP